MFPTELDSTLKKKEILLFVTMWMNLENHTPNDVSQRNTNTAWPPLWEEGWEAGEKRGCGQKAQSLSDARCVRCGDGMHSTATALNTTVPYPWDLLRIDLTRNLTTHTQTHRTTTQRWWTSDLAWLWWCHNVYIFQNTSVCLKNTLLMCQTPQ